jgi:hypothetical protein
LLNNDFDPYDEILDLRNDLGILAAHMETLTSHLKQNSWMIEEITNQLKAMGGAFSIMHDRLVKLEELNEKD